MRYLWAEGVEPSGIHRRMSAQYGTRTMKQRMVDEWVEGFKAERIVHGRRLTEEG